MDMSRAIEHKEVLYANNLAFDENTSAKSLMDIKNASGPVTEPWEAHGLLLVQEETCPVRITL